MIHFPNTSFANTEKEQLDFHYSTCGGNTTQRRQRWGEATQGASCPGEGVLAGVGLWLWGRGPCSGWGSGCTWESFPPVVGVVGVHAAWGRGPAAVGALAAPGKGSLQWWALGLHYAGSLQLGHSTCPGEVVPAVVGGSAPSKGLQQWWVCGYWGRGPSRGGYSGWLRKGVPVRVGVGEQAALGEGVSAAVGIMAATGKGS